ncbi:3',5'-cyclic-nucleotide phosphodiesterase 2 [Nakaseomyces bracarensis]|uniref:Phosphodiesterase n=1 Tax=Nakaseomyces bracarensis TaxID=273131 RepID=A0ABR4NXV5_9SACH
MTSLLLVGSEYRNIDDDEVLQRFDLFDRLAKFEDETELVTSLYKDRLSSRPNRWTFETSASVVVYDSGSGNKGLTTDKLRVILHRFFPAFNLIIVENFDELESKRIMHTLQNDRVIGTDTISRINHWMYHKAGNEDNGENDSCFTNIYSLMNHLTNSNKRMPSEPIPRFIRSLNFKEFFEDIVVRHGSEESMREYFLEKLSTWEFSAIEFSTRELLLCGFFLIQKLSREANVLISDNKLLLLLMTVEASYHQINKFHNFRHAVDVMQATWQICSHVKNNKAVKLQPIIVLMLSISAIGHDIGHPGTNNQLLCQHNAHLAVYFGNQSVLENFHNTLFQNLLADHWPQSLKAATVKLNKLDDMGKPMDQFNDFSNFNDGNENNEGNDKNKTINIITNAILATDMALHAKYVEKLEGNVKVPQSLPFQTLIAVIIKAADISNVTRPLYISARWAFLITLEFNDCSQLENYVKEANERTDTVCNNNCLSPNSERIDDPEFYKRNNPQYIIDLIFNKEGESDTDYMKRLLDNYPYIPNGQIFFINTFAGRFFNKIGELFPELKFLSDNVQSNKSYWESVQRS